MAKSTHDFAPDPRNDSILISINGELVPRAEATVSVFDSGFMLGDGIWESMRVERGVVLFWDQHADRLFEGGKALALDLGLTREQLRARIDACLKANDLRDDVHIRLMVTRGIRSTPYQSPRVVVSSPTVVIIPEVKAAQPLEEDDGLAEGVGLLRRAQRERRPHHAAADDQDLRLHMPCPATRAPRRLR